MFPILCVYSKSVRSPAEKLVQSNLSVIRKFPTIVAIRGQDYEINNRKHLGRIVFWERFAKCTNDHIYILLKDNYALALWYLMHLLNYTLK